MNIGRIFSDQSKERGTFDLFRVNEVLSVQSLGRAADVQIPDEERNESKSPIDMDRVLPQHMEWRQFLGGESL